MKNAKNLKIVCVLVILFLFLLLCGCEKRECIKSHQEDSMCTYMRCMPSGKSVMCMPYILPCKKTICDEYKIGEEV